MQGKGGPVTVSCDAPRPLLQVLVQGVRPYLVALNALALLIETQRPQASGAAQLPGWLREAPEPVWRAWIERNC